MGWSIEVLLSIMKFSFAYQFFYVHDYFSLCSEYRLLRNNIIPCDAPLLDSINCNICAHGDTRTGHVTGFKKFFNELKPTLIYPSNCSKKIFEAGYAAKMKSVVVPHIQVSQKPVSKNNRVRLKDKIRIAFCGSPVAHKGFYHFEEIVDKSLSNICLEFFHFGSVDAKLQNVEFVKTVLKNGKSPMVKKIEEYEIDIVFIGSTWRETFNFVAYEALQAGAAIIALTSSGNVCDVIEFYKVGQTVNSWQECLELFNDTNLTEKLDMWQTAINGLSFAENKSFLTKGVLPK
jgi:hypothetical protein